MAVQKTGFRIYTASYCGYCHAALATLARLGLPVENIDVTNDDEKRAWLVEETGMRTVPQIWFGDEHIGGYDNLRAWLPQHPELAAGA